MYEKVLFADARAQCDLDSVDANFPGLLHLPMPKNIDENDIYRDILSEYGSYPKHTWLDITETPNTNSEERLWQYKDGTSVSWFNWHKDEPNGAQYNENNVEMVIDRPLYGSWDANWNDIAGNPTSPDYPGTAICTYLLPKGAEKSCTWLIEEV